MSADSWFGIVLLATALVVLVTATAAEAGVVFLSRLRVHAFATKGLPRAAALETYIRERRALLGTLAIARDAAVVLGIAVGTFLVLRETEHSWAALAVTMAVALLALAVLEALPRLLVAHSPERWSLRLVPAIRVLRLCFWLPSRALDMLASTLLGKRADRERPFEPNGEDEEILRLVEMHEGNGKPENGEMAMIRRVANMVDRSVREIITPRIDMVAVEADVSIDDVLRVITERGYSRIPLYDETVDNIVGIVYAKDLLRHLAEGQKPRLRDVARPAYFIPEGKHIDELLTELREHKVHLAIVVDEYGGTAGLVTIEDVLEEIVGEIQDEYDREEVTIERVSDDEAIVDARVSLDDLNELFDLEIESEDFDTLGGFVYHELGRMPAPGDEVQADGLRLKVLSVLGRRIKKVRVSKNAATEEDPTHASQQA